jgi:hypothetical protein
MGSNLIEGVPGIIVIEDSDLCEALAECIEIIVRVALERTAPKLSTDISDHGAHEWRLTDQESRQAHPRRNRLARLHRAQSQFADPVTLGGGVMF